MPKPATTTKMRGKATKGPLMRFKLLAGQHIGVDPRDRDEFNKKIESGEQPEGARAPARTYAVGETIVSDIDLAEKLGSNKFARIGDLRTRDERAEDAPVVSSAAPGGQVGSGFQSSTSLADGTTVSGPADKIETQASKNRKAQDDEDEDFDEDADEGNGKDGLESMTVAQLKQKAADEEIDLHGAKSKDEIVEAIRKKESGPGDDDDDDDDDDN